jgi:8-oxo-dGTP pyrophosphatase MutT (NUDIX family)
LSRRTLLDTGKFLKVESHKVELPDGQIIEDWPWVIIPDYVNVVAVTPDQEFICFRQVKYAVEGTSLAVVGGMIDPGEKAIDAAKRELREETGFEAHRWIALGEYRVDANRGVGKGHLFLASGAIKVCEPRSDDLEEQELLFMRRDEVLSAVKAGEFKVLSWAAALAIALFRLSDLDGAGP